MPPLKHSRLILIFLVALCWCRICFQVRLMTIEIFLFDHTFNFFVTHYPLSHISFSLSYTLLYSHTQSLYSHTHMFCVWISIMVCEIIMLYDSKYKLFLKGPLRESKRQTCKNWLETQNAELYFMKNEYAFFLCSFPVTIADLLLIRDFPKVCAGVYFQCWQIGYLTK